MYKDFYILLVHLGVLEFGTEGGARYAGCFNNNTKHGAGVVVCENGRILESNPIFYKNKPVHLTTSGSIDLSSTQNQEHSSESVIQIYNSPDTKKTVTPNSNFQSPRTRLPEEKCLENRKSSLEMIMDQINYSKSLEMEKSIRENINNNCGKFPEIKFRYNSFKVPVLTSIECINLNWLVEKVLKLLKNCGYLGESRDVTSSNNTGYYFHLLGPIKGVLPFGRRLFNGFFGNSF